MAEGPHVTRLRLTQFRNHRKGDLRLGAQMVAFTGPNGAGKTNILEALSLLSPGRGLRRATYADMAMDRAMDRALDRAMDRTLDDTPDPTGVAAGGFAIAADVLPADHVDGEDPLPISTGIAGPAATGRDVRINKVSVRSAEVLLEHVALLWLTPAMDGLFTGPASERRRFFDRMVMALHPAHGRMAARFEQAMRARNRMLDDGVGDPVWFEGVEAQMAQAGSAMQGARLATLGLLRAAIGEARDAVSAFPHAVLALAGFEGLDGEDAYRRALAEGRPRDRAAGRTLEGPHRVDLLVRHGPKDVEARLASTGEQKALLIGLILAQARLVKRETGRAAILLLDEIAAHLDARRRAALYTLCRELGGQTFMTGTDAALFDALGDDADRFAVDDGRIERRP